MDLPTLKVTSLGGKRRVLDLKVLVPGSALEAERGDYYERYMRAHPLDKEARAEIDREFESAVARRMRQFGALLHAHLDTLRTAA